MNQVNEEIFQKSLEITTTGIQRCHRLGPKVEKKQRPVIVTFLDYREDTSVIKNAFKLKGTTISTSEDIPNRVRKIRKHLWKSAAEEKENDTKVKLLYDKLSIDYTLYGWNETKQSCFILQKKAY